jgi:thiol-disulfide isomerase/thioredoxin
MKYTLLFYSLLLTTFAFSQSAQLVGINPSYASEELVFYRFSDFISQTEEVVGRCKVSRDGKFNCELKIDETTFIFSYLGVYRVYIYVEPGKTYRIILPPKEDKTEVQRLNPFFREVETHVGIENIQSTDLNYLISSFDLSFNEHFDTIVQNAYSRKRTLPIDSLVMALEARFEQYGQPFFKTYRNYRYGLLYQLSLMQKARSISNKYFLSQPIQYNNPAYMELFNLVYDKYFVFFSRSEEGAEIFGNITEEKSYTKLKKTLANDNVLANDSLLELVILKGLHDSFFDDKFSRSALVSVLDSLYRTTKIAEHLLIAENIRSRVTRLLPGFVPSPFELYNLKGELVTPDQFEGKYVYLNFCTSSSYSCLQEFTILEKFYEKHKGRIEIVTISVDRDINDLKSFLKQTNYKWTFLHYGNKPEIIKDFDIRAYPTYFLIGPDRRLIMSPAPSPRENFEILFFNLLRSRGEI